MRSSFPSSAMSLDHPRCATADGFELERCSCAGCVHYKYQFLTSKKTCFDRCHQVQWCSVALYDAKGSFCWLYWHGKETVKDSEDPKKTRFTCFVRSSACKSSVKCRLSKEGRFKRLTFIAKTPPPTAKTLATLPPTAKPGPHVKKGHKKQAKEGHGKQAKKKQALKGCANCRLDHFIDAPTLRSSLASLATANQKHVTVVLFGSPQGCLFDNFITRVSRLSFGTVVTCNFDMPAYRLCMRLGNAIHQYDSFRLICVRPKDGSKYHNGPPPGKPVHFADPYYSTLVSLRPTLLLEGLQMGMPTLLTDLDVIWREEPFSYLSKRKLGIEGIFVLQKEQAGRTSLDSAIVYANNSSQSLKQARIWSENSAGGYNDNSVLNALHEFLPKRFRTLQKSSLDAFRSDCGGCDDPLVVASHCACGRQKMRCMQYCSGWWKLSVHNSTSSDPQQKCPKFVADVAYEK